MIKPDHLRERLRERVREDDNDPTYCPSCDCQLTSTDYEAGECTTCRLSLDVNAELFDEDLIDEDDD